MSNLLDQSHWRETLTKWPPDWDTVFTGCILGALASWLPALYAGILIGVTTIIYEWKFDGTIIKIPHWSDAPGTPWEWNDVRDILISALVIVALVRIVH